MPVAPDKFQVHQHWDPLKVCVVGRSYPPEFYSFIADKKIRSIFELLALQTEEDFQLLIKKLQEFGVEIWRPDIMPEYQLMDMGRNQYREPPMTPRDDMIMIGDRFYRNRSCDWKVFYRSVRDDSWPEHTESINDLPLELQHECREVHGYGNLIHSPWDPYKFIIEKIQSRNTKTKHSPHSCINGAGVARLGEDLVIGIENQLDSQPLNLLGHEFADYKLHIAEFAGHADGSYCPVCPGLIVSHFDSETYRNFFPNWQIVQVRPSIEAEFAWSKYRKLTGGRWWLPEFGNDSRIVEVVETHLNNFVGYVDETAFEVNMLMIDPKNAISFSYNSQVERTLNSFGINLHVIPFRHRYFWDGGAHCVTLDIHRLGIRQKVL